MSEYAPQAIKDLFAAVQRAVPAAVLSGIVGDASHVYGYHRCRDVLPASDYSVAETPRDRAGDGEAASALDISLPSNLMPVVTGRLMAACKNNDPRVANLREFFGTLDGSTVTGWDRLAGGYTSSDDSHLWHVHLSFFRDSATDAAALAPIASVIAGSAAVPTSTPTRKGPPELHGFVQYDKRPDIKNKSAVYMHDGVGGTQVWITSPAELSDRQARVKAAGGDPTVVHTEHSRGYFGVVVGQDPEAV